MAYSTKTKRAKRKGTKHGGEAPCKACAAIIQQPKRDRKGRFSKAKR